MANVKNPLVFIFITILIDCIGIGIIFPVIATLIMDITHTNESQAIIYGGWLTVCYAGMQFFFSPVLGGISDRYGRRPVLLLSLLGLGIDYVFLAFAQTLPWLFVGRIIAGICGASFTTGFAYVADVSAPEKRAQNFGMMGAAFGFGFIIGPLIGGVVGAQFGPRAPFIAAAILSLLNWLYGYFVLPESLPKENRRKFDWKRANPFGAFIQLRKNKQIIWLVVGTFVLYIAGQVMPVVWPYYAKLMFKWSDDTIGYSLAFVGVMVAIVQGGLIGLAQKKLGPVKTIIVGLMFYVGGLLLFAVADQPWMVFAFTAVYALGGIAPPSMQGIISSRIPANEQGELQGLLTSIMSLTTIISPFIFMYVFYEFTKPGGEVFFPGAPFAGACILCAVAFVIVLFALRQKQTVPDVVDSPEEVPAE